MRISRILRWTVLVAILATFAPAPASAQIGRFIKKKLQEKIAKAAIESVVPADTPVTPVGAQAGGPAGPQQPAGAKKPTPGAEKAAPGRAVKGAEPAANPSGPQFSFWVLEMTPEVLDKLEKGLAAEATQRAANDRVLKRMQDKAAYDRCLREVSATPEGKQAHDDFTSGDMERYRKGSVAFEKLMEEKCGPSPSTYETVKSKLASKVWNAGPAGSGLESRQYEILKERALPFCSLTPRAAGEVKIPVQGGMFLVYSPAEVQALSGRCSKLLPALKAGV